MSSSSARSLSLTLAFALAALATTARAQAPEEETEEPLPLDLTASFFVRYDLRENYTEVGQVDADSVRYRTRFGLIAGPMDLGDLALTLRFVPQASGRWFVGGDTLEDVNLGLHEGLMMLSRPTWRLDAGRFEMVYGDHLVIGNVGWHETGRSFDGMRLHVQPEQGGVWVDGFATIIGEGIVTPGDNSFAAGDTYFGGVYAGLGGLISEGFALDAYALVLATVAETVFEGDPPAPVERPGSARVTLGSRVKNRSGLLDYRLEAGVQLGDAGNDRSIFAWQADLEVGVNLLDDKLRIGLEGLYASGDDPDTADTNEAWNQLFPTAHKWLGFADIIGGRTNITGGVLHLTLKPAQRWTLSLDGHLFVRPEDTRVVNPADPMDVTIIESGMAGVEGDLGAAYSLGEGLAVRTNYSLFLPNEDWYGGSDPVHFWELELRYDM